MTIDELITRYGDLRQEAGEVLGELKARLHFAKEFADLPERVEVKINHRSVADMIAIPPTERKEYDDKYQEHGSMAGMIMRTMNEFPTSIVDTGAIYAKALQLFPDRTFSKNNMNQTISRLANNNLIHRVSRGQYKRKEVESGG